MAVRAIKGAFYIPFSYGKNKANSLGEKMLPYAQSILGNWVLSFSMEAAGAYGSTKVCKPLGKMVVAHITPVVAPYAMQGACLTVTVLSSASFISQPSQIRLAILVTTIALCFLQITYLSEGEFKTEGPQWFGERLGEIVGTVVGGYLGLRLAGRLIQRLQPPQEGKTQSVSKLALIPYAKGALRFEGAGYLFNATIFPAHDISLILIRQAVKSFLQGVAYSAPQIIPFMRGCVRGQAKSALLPLLVQMFCREYCDANSVRLSDQLLRHLIPSSSFLPTILQKGALKWSQSIVSSRLNTLPKQTGALTTIAMRGLHGYMALLDQEPTKTALQSYRSNPHIYEKAFRKALKEAIPGSSTLSPLFDQFLQSTLNEWSDSIVETIQEAEKAFIGSNMLRVDQLKNHLNIHLKYYFLYVLINHDTCVESMSSKEEEEFLIDANHAVFSLIGASMPQSSVLSGTQTTFDVIIRGLYGLRRAATNFKTTSHEQHTQLLAYTFVETDYMKDKAPQKRIKIDTQVAPGPVLEEPETESPKTPEEILVVPEPPPSPTTASFVLVDLKAIPAKV